MKNQKKVWGLLPLFCLFFLTANSQINLTLVHPLDAQICESNNIRGTIQIGPNIPTSFTLTLKAELFDGNLLISLPPTSYPSCNDFNPVVGDNPVQLVLDVASFGWTTFNGQQVQQATISPQPTFNATNNEYEWTITVSNQYCGSGCILEFSGRINLDCSLIPQSNPTPQQQFTLNLDARINSNAWQNYHQIPVPIPFITDMNSNSPFQAVLVGGNYQQVDDMIFVYKNNGFADLHIDFTFEDEYLLNCITPAYQSLGLWYAVAGSQPTLIANPFGSFNQYTGSTTIILPKGESIFIWQKIKVTACTQNPICSTEQNGLFNWKCHNVPPLGLPYEVFCAKCQHHYLTPIVFTYDIPKFTIELLNTNPINAQFSDLTCPGENVTWNVKVKNESSFSTLKEVVLEFNNPAYGKNGLTTIYPGSLHINSTQNFNVEFPPTLFEYPINPDPTELPACYEKSGEYSLEKFFLLISEIPAQGEVLFSFETYKCCNPDADFGVNKSFNQWTTAGKAITGCDAEIGSSTVSPPSLDLSLFSNGGISTHSNSTLNNDADDLNLNLIYIAASTIDVNVPPTAVTQNYSYGIDEKISQKIYLTKIFGDQNDHQIFGNNGSGTPKGILEIMVHCDKGLFIDQNNQLNGNIIWGDYEVQLSYNSAGGPVLVPYLSNHVLLAGTATPLYPDVSNFVPPVVLSPQLPKYYQDCEPGDFYFYYDLSTIPDIEALLTSGRFDFTLTPCCSAEPVSNYDVSFRLLMTQPSTNLPNNSCYSFSLPLSAGDAPNCPSCCWIPLSKIDGTLIVHCPGCLAPGAIVDFYQMRRLSFGFEDPNNLRIASNTSSPITPGNTYYETNFQNLNTTSSVHGDLVTDTLIAHFQPGDFTQLSSNIYHRGYTYDTKNPFNNNNNGSDMLPNLSGWNNINLNVLQLYKKIDFAGCEKMNLEIESVIFYVDDIIGTSGAPCEDCDPNSKPKYYNRGTILKYTITNPTAPHHYQEISSGTNKEMIFTFRTSDFSGQTSPYGLLNYPNGYTPGFIFTENQQYRMVVTYKVKGNITGPFYNPQNFKDQLHLESMILNWMWLTGGGPSGDGFNLSNWSSIPQMPNIIYDPSNTITILDMENDNLFFDPNQIYCNGCNQADQSNFGDSYRFYCEPRSGLHHFFSTDHSIFTNYGSAGNGTCDRTIGTKLQTSFGRGLFPGNQNLTGGSGHYDLFPFEFRPPSILPNNMSLTGIPTGYTLESAATWNRSYHLNGSTLLQFQSQNNPINPNFSNGTISFTQNSLGLLNNITAPLSSNYTDIRVSDEYFEENFTFILRPGCTQAQQGVNFAFTDATLQCGTINGFTDPLNTTVSTYTCGGTVYGGPTHNEFYVFKWLPVNPNLQFIFTPAAEFAISNKVCWDFSLTNLPVVNYPAFTGAPNVFLEIPSNIPELNSWTLDFNFNNTIYSNIPLTGNYFHLFPLQGTNGVMPLSNDILSGTLCADYEGCLNTASINFKLGWHCSPDFNLPIYPSLCSTTQINSALVDIAPNIQIVNNSQLVNGVAPFAASLTLCSSTTNTMLVHFTNLSAGIAVANMINFGNLQNVNITGVTINDYCDSDHLPIQLTIPSNPNFDPWVIPSGTWLDELGFDACVEVLVEFTPLCQFGSTFILPEVNLLYHSFCELPTDPLHSIGAAFDPVPIGASACTDCFLITKTPSASTVASGTELINYTVTLGAFNAPGTYTVSINEGAPSPGNIGYPAGYISDLDPFLPNGTGTIFTSIQCSGNQPSYNIIIQPSSNSMQGYLSPGNTTICNTVFLTSSIGTTFTSPPACVNVLPSCIDLFPGAYEIPNNASYSMVAVNLTATNIIRGKFYIDQSAVLSNMDFIAEPGAEIIVNAGKQLQISRCNFNACTKMWRGITVLNGGATPSYLNISRSTINNALYAIYANNRTIIDLNESRFNDNYVGLHVPPVSSAGVKGNNVALSIYYCNFNGTGTMLPMYQCTTCPFVSAEIPNAGIEVADISLKFPSQGINSFTNLSNGILGYRSNLIIQNSFFNKIHAQPDYDATNTWQVTNNFNGSAIFGSGIYKTSSTGMRAVLIDQTGFGNQQGVSQITFENCDYGIYADAISLRSSDNIMNGMQRGYRSRLAQRQTTIVDNVLDAAHSGIELFIYDQAVTTVVENNEITFGSILPGGYYSWAIRAEGTPIYQDLARISYNNIFFRNQSLNSYGGILTNSSKNLHITHNRLEMKDNTRNLNGILMSGCIENTVSCNWVVGAGNDYDPKKYQSAITSEMCIDPEIGCNTVDKTTNGITILGPSAPGNGNNVNIRSNNFNHHYFGLNYSLYAVTNSQILCGNLWWQNPVLYNNIQGFQTNHEDLNIVNQFINTANPTIPVGATFVYLPPNIYQNPTNWFQSSPGLNLFCDDDNSNLHYCNSYPPTSISPITDYEIKIAEGNINNGPFSSETEWIMQKGLYSKIDDNQSMLSDSTMDAFYQSKYGTALASLKKIEDSKSTLFKMDTMNRTFFSSHTSLLDQQLNLLLVEIDLLDSAVSQNDTSEITFLIGSIGAIQENLNSTDSQADSLFLIELNSRVISTDSIQLSNTTLSCINIPELNEKQVNEIYLITLAKNNFEFTASQQQLLLSIAEQCPVSGGLAVFKARALLSLFSPNLHFDDRQLCESSGGIRLQSNSPTKTTHYKVYPNPAMNEVTVEYKLSEKGEAWFTIYSTSGQTVSQKELAIGHPSTIVNTESLRPGVYQYSITSTSETQHGKLVIIK
jgi:hypothetical protein